MTRYILIFLIDIGVVSAATASDEYQCGFDSNGSGYIDEAELQPCYVSDNNGSTRYLCPIEAQACSSPAPGLYECPLGPSYSCYESESGTMMCSPHACSEITGPDVVTQPAGNDPIPTSDAPVTDTGCQGTIRIFSGHKATCRPAGSDNFWRGCCRSSGPTSDSMNGNQLAQLDSYLTLAPLLNPSCPADDVKTASMADSGMCIYVGSYCGTSVPLVGCIQEVKSYCCFNSVLARLIQEQGKPQLPAMGGWGSAKQPDCDGFTPAEFQSLDFSKIDLSSYYSQLQYSSQQQIEDSFNSNGYGP